MTRPPQEPASPKAPPKRGLRLGGSCAEERVRESIAIVTLDGLKPSAFAIELMYQVAEGKISADEAVAILCNLYSTVSS